ncbi:endoplasmic oxidoreductin-1 [Knufia obscura]|uniref:Endoplasmic oxidoreductin-1 n=2 Tax=Knufia TaxID=430999 RepID=A0AAN8ER27_9EURO|nr:endoplasmic oxidoreductin-1 [Knufia obscura]KAK5950353.1 endoplasmic oxidoreductin-1 [Knufia fluminis]
MGFHARRFYLACFALLGLSHAVQADSQCAIDPKSTVTDACTSYSDLDTLNRDIAPTLKELTEADFFAYYRLNLYNKVCPFWSDENSICGNRACAVDTIDDEDDIPPIWKIEELSKLEGARAQHPGPGQRKERTQQRPLSYQLGENVDESCVYEADDECDERDYCVPEDEGAASKGDYVSLLNNAEKFTGYAGPGANQVWDAIYKENCFSKPSSASPPTNTGLHAAAELRNIFQEHGRQNLETEHDSASLNDQCIEQRAFYRVISGMHASISTHLCWDYYNQTSGSWFRNIECYKQRLHSHPDRISNLYFNYALVTRAIAKLNKHLQSYTFCSGDPDQDLETKAKVRKLTGHLASVPNTFDENMLFQDPGMMDLKDDFKQRFRNVSRIMDCVGCDKCRLWGKLQTAGYGAALKVLFEFDENKNGENPHLRRTELVALINTYGRLSHSMEATRWFREHVNAHSDGPADAVTTAPAELPTKRASHRSPQEAASKQWVPQPISPPPSNKDEKDAEQQPKPRKPRPQLTLWEEIKGECNLVWRAYVMVLKSWIELPGKLSHIFLMEMSRLWNFWLGLPVPPRSWEIEFPKPPRRDEL